MTDIGLLFRNTSKYSNFFMRNAIGPQVEGITDEDLFGAIFETMVSISMSIGEGIERYSP